jgi:Circularly permutated YpsA SLOG family/Domain of unknown function (DUF6794)
MLKKIISGGQTGVEQAALDAAIKYKFSHGGWIQKDRKTEDGILPYKYKLKELKSGAHPNYTERNVINSDGAVIISHGKLKGGSALPKKLANKHKRSCLHIDLDETPAFIASSKINSWIIEHDIEILNVTGSRASKDPKIYEVVKYIIEGVIVLSLVHAQAGSTISDYSKDEYLDKLPAPPKTIDEAVNRLIEDLDLRDKVKMANMNLDELVNIHSALHVYFKNAFGLWSGNKELLADCASISNESIYNEDDASAVILGVLWQKLQENYTLRVVK